LWRFVNAFCRDSTIQESRPLLYLLYVESEKPPQGGGEGAFKTWYELLRELKSAHGDRFKIYACPLAA
jgi:peroxiredoxin family protein